MGSSNRLFRVINCLVIYLFVVTSAFQPFEYAYAQIDQETQAAIDACDEQGPAYRWDSNTNRCIRISNMDYDESERKTDVGHSMQKEYEKCQEMTDEDERKDCHDNFARNIVNPRDQEDWNYATWGTTGLNAIFAIIMFFNLAGSKDTGNTCHYRTIFKITSAAGLLFDLYIEFMAKKNLTELQENYKEEAVSEDPYQAQVRAFNYLKDEQTEIAKLAGLRMKEYIMLTIGYTLTLVLASIALGTDASTGGLASGFTGCYVPNKDLTWLAHPGTTIGFSAAALIYAGVLLGYAIDEKMKAETRAGEIDGIIEKFASSVAGYCPSGRENLAEPRCYCYTSDGKKNQERTNSETCQNLWANDERNFFADAGDYSKQKTKNPVGCMTRDRKFDAECKCKKLKDKNGQNACYKIPASAQITMPGLASSNNKFLKDINDITNGNTSPSDLNTGELAQSAIALGKARNKAIQKLNKDRKLAKKKPFKLTSASDAKVLMNKLAPAALKATKGSLIASAGPIKNNSLAKAVKAAKNNPAMKKVMFSGGGKGLMARKKKKKSGFNLNFADGGRGGKVEDGFMNKSYNYAKNQNDIVNRDDVSIFQVITNRYNSTGLQRLFGDEQEILEK